MRQRGWNRDFGPAAALRLGLLPLAALLSGCVSDSPMQPVVRPPLAARMDYAPASGVAPLTVTFDGTASRGGYLPLTVDYDFDGDGTYDLTDGGLTESHTYTVPGVYSPRMRMRQSTGVGQNLSVSRDGITVLPAAAVLPTASLAASVTSGNAPLPVEFNASASADGDGSIARYDYDFNSDGIWDAYDSGPQVTWTFAEHGDYTVRLRVTDNSGGQGAVQLAIAVNATPVAQLTASATTATPGGTITFSAAGSSDADGNIVRYEWDADGNGSYEQNTGTVSQLQVLFPNAGTFTVRLRVADNSGAIASSEVQVLIEI